MEDYLMGNSEAIAADTGAEIVVEDRDFGKEVVDLFNLDSIAQNDYVTVVKEPMH